jgi:acetyl esterase
MAVDPGFQALLQDRRNELRPPSEKVSLEQLRSANRSWLMAAPSVTLHAVENIAVTGPGGSLPLRVYRPHEHAAPAILFCHGGGFVLGDLDTHDSICSRLAAYSAATVISVGYRLAPETRFPGAVADCHCALETVARMAPQLRLDPSRLAIAGDSAGAHVAFGVLLSARSNGPAVKAAGLLYPMTDPDSTLPSIDAFGRGFLLSAAAVRWFWAQYLGGGQRTDPCAALLQANLAGLPPLSISTAECDPLRDEGAALAERARAAGNPVRYRCYAGMVHGFAGMPQLTPVAELALRELASDLRTALQ